MIRGIDYQKVDMCEEEWDYYQELVKKFTTETQNGADYFCGLFTTDKNGVITIIKLSKPIPWEVIFFTMNLQQNQHLREFDGRIAQMEHTIAGMNWSA